MRVTVLIFYFFVSAPFCFGEPKNVQTNSEDPNQNWIYPDQINRQEDYPDLMDLPVKPIQEGHLSLNLPIFSEPIQFYPEAAPEAGQRFKRHDEPEKSGSKPERSGSKLAWNVEELEELFKLILQRNGLSFDDMKNAAGYPRSGQDYLSVNRRDGLKVLRLRRSEKTAKEQLQINKQGK